MVKTSKQGLEPCRVTFPGTISPHSWRHSEQIATAGHRTISGCSWSYLQHWCQCILVLLCWWCCWKTLWKDTARAGKSVRFHYSMHWFWVCSHYGLGQNRDKQEHVPFFAKAWAHGHYRSMFCDNLLAGKVCRQTRYLDPPCTFNGSQNGLWQQNLVGWLVGASGHDCLVVIKETLHFSWYGLHSRITGRVANLCFRQICTSRVRQVRQVRQKLLVKSSSQIRQKFARNMSEVRQKFVRSSSWFVKSLSEIH